MAFFGLFGKKSKEEKESLDQGLQKTKMGIFEKISRAIVGKSTVDDDVLDGIEEALIASDIGVDTTLKIIESLQDRVARDKFMNTEELNTILREEIEKLLNINPSDDSSNEEEKAFDFSKKPYVIMVVGVNGVGKTTTIGKLAARLKNSGKKVVLGAADTFRAAAVDQLCPHPFLQRLDQGIHLALRFFVLDGQQHTGLDVHQMGCHRHKLTGHLQIHLLTALQPTDILVANQRNRDILDLHLILAQKEQDQIQRALKVLHLLLFGANHLF